VTGKRYAALSTLSPEGERGLVTIPVTPARWFISLINRYSRTPSALRDWYLVDKFELDTGLWRLPRRKRLLREQVGQVIRARTANFINLRACP
jgi:hypothetical protein